MKHDFKIPSSLRASNNMLCMFGWMDGFEQCWLCMRRKQKQSLECFEICTHNRRQIATFSVLEAKRVSLNEKTKHTDLCLFCIYICFRKTSNTIEALLLINSMDTEQMEICSATKQLEHELSIWTIPYLLNRIVTTMKYSHVCGTHSEHALKLINFIHRFHLLGSCTDTKAIHGTEWYLSWLLLPKLCPKNRDKWNMAYESNINYRKSNFSIRKCAYCE